MALTLQALIDAPIIELDSVDSTNNYAMQLIDSEKAQNGLTITAKQQTKGRGQRGKQWNDLPGRSLLMSIILHPNARLDQQFLFSASIANAIAKSLQQLNNSWNVRIKWPNDIIINDKKTAGILIENTLRGSNWTYSVLGLGLNVLQDHFPESLPNAGSLKIASGIDYDVDMVRDLVRKAILEAISLPLDPESVMNTYNSFLYHRNETQSFTKGDEQWDTTVLEATKEGTLKVRLSNGEIAFYTHGSVEWHWG